MAQSYLRLTLVRAWQNVWNSRSASGSIAQLAATAIAGVVVYFATAASERSSVIVGVVAAIGASIFVLALIGATHLILAQKSLYDEACRERDEAQALIAALTAPGSLSSDVRLQRDPNSGGLLLRLSLANTGNQDIPDSFINIIYPASWTTFEGCTEAGLYLYGRSIESDEPLPGDVPAKLWMYRSGAIEAHVTSLLFFRVAGPPGSHSIVVRLERLSVTHTVDLPQVEPAEEVPTT